MKDAPAKESAIKTWDVDRPAVIETSWNSPSVEVVGHVSPFDHRRPTRHRKFGPWRARRANVFASRCFERPV